MKLMTIEQLLVKQLTAVPSVPDMFKPMMV